MSGAKTIRALTRAMDVVQVLDRRHRTPLGTLSECTGLSHATLLRILHTLEAGGWVYQYRADSSYRLASAVCSLGDQVYTSDRLVEAAAPILDRLRETLGWPSDLGVAGDGAMRVLESTRRTPYKRAGIDPIDERPPLLLSELGRAYLAFCPPSEREAALDRLRQDSMHRVHARRSRIERLLDEVRARGHAFAEPGYWHRYLDYEMDADAVAVPVTYEGRVRCCISLVWERRRAPDGLVEREWVPELRRAAAELAALQCSTRSAA